MSDVRQITKDEAYDAVAPDDFPAMMNVDRYNARSTAFDKIISATHDHFWDPLDTKYIDYSEAFDIENEFMMPEEFFIELNLPSFQALTQKQRVRFANESVRWMLSSILHGEQGALNLSSSLCHVLRDPGAQEYAANQTREEARHVTGFAKYIQARWGKPLPVGQTLGDLLTDIVGAREVYKKIVGMQMLVEGLAMGAFATFYSNARDPLLVKLMQLVMTDEAFHHKFGKIWADRTVPNLPEAERDMIEDWALEVFLTLLRNSTGPEQKKVIYEKIGLDWQWVQSALMEAMTDKKLRSDMQESTSIFRVLIKTLLKAGIITKRTAGQYAAYVDMEELHAEGDRMIGDDIAEQGIRALLEINGAGGEAAIYAMGNVQAAE
jgi:hypothetical protein